MALLIFKFEPKSLMLELQQPIVSRPLLRIAEEGIGVDNLPKSQRSIRVASVEVGMGRLDGFAERLSESFIVGIRTNTEKIIECIHRYALEQRLRKKRIVKKTCIFLSAPNERGRMIFLKTSILLSCLAPQRSCAARGRIRLAAESPQSRPRGCYE